MALLVGPERVFSGSLAYPITHAIASGFRPSLVAGADDAFDAHHVACLLTARSAVAMLGMLKFGGVSFSGAFTGDVQLARWFALRSAVMPQVGLPSMRPLPSVPSCAARTDRAAVAVFARKLSVSASTDFKDTALREV